MNKVSPQRELKPLQRTLGGALLTMAAMPFLGAVLEQFGAGGVALLFGGVAGCVAAITIRLLGDVACPHCGRVPVLRAWPPMFWPFARKCLNCRKPQY